MVNQNVEYREFERFPIEFEVEVYAREGSGRHHLETAGLRDVSNGGVCFFSTCPNIYVIGQLLFLSIHLPGTDKVDAAMQGEVTVIWIGKQKESPPNEPGRSYIGVCMDDLLAFSCIVQDQSGDQGTGRKPE